MRKAKWFSKLDLAQAFHQLPIKEEDRHKTAFQDPSGRLLQWTVCNFGICTIPAVFSAAVSDDYRELLYNGVLKWLDDITIYLLRDNRRTFRASGEGADHPRKP